MDQSLLKLRTFGELKHAGYRTKPVRLEMRDNLLERKFFPLEMLNLEAGQELCASGVRKALLMDSK
jgi:hypothetical protein